MIFYPHKSFLSFILVPSKVSNITSNVFSSDGRGYPYLSLTFIVSILNYVVMAYISSCHKYGIMLPTMRLKDCFYNEDNVIKLILKWYCVYGLYHWSGFSICD